MNETVSVRFQSAETANTCPQWVCELSLNAVILSLSMYGARMYENAQYSSDLILFGLDLSQTNQRHLPNELKY